VAHRDLVVIGASAGGIEAVQQLLAGLPPNLDAAVLIVVHTSSHAGGFLPRIFERAGRLPVVHPEDSTPIQRGHVYVAPPDFHMIVEGDLLRIVQGPRENLHRRAIDPLFRSAAASYGRRVIGIILTGLLDDGTSGLMVVHSHGGQAIVQDPDTAMFASMPASALEQVPSAQVLPLPEIAGRLVELIGGKRREQAPKERSDKEPADEIKAAELDMSHRTWTNTPDKLLLSPAPTVAASSGNSSKMVSCTSAAASGTHLQRAIWRPSRSRSRSRSKSGAKATEGVSRSVKEAWARSTLPAA
jgi:two-component system, chemotaxis family, protein-glutamate methylesterase/glutaminase